MKIMNHIEYQRKLKRLSEDALRYRIDDCKSAIEAYPDNPNCGYYQDEIHYCAAELERRER